MLPQNHPMPMFRRSESNRRRRALAHIAALQVFVVTPFEHHRHEPPRMVMQRPVVIVSHELVQVQIDKPIPGSQVPSQ
jgi:hypothetical protein